MENISTINRYSEETFRKICWPAIFGGITVAIILSLLLNLLGIGLGFAAFTPDMESLKTLSASAIGWIFFSGIVSMFIAGWVSSALSSDTDSTKGYWQGFIVAGISVLSMYYIATSSISSVVGGTLGMVSSLRSGVNVETNNSTTVSNQNDNPSNFSKDGLVNKAKNLLPESMNPLIDQISYEADILGTTLNEQISENLPNAKEVQGDAKAVKAKAELYRKKVGPALRNFLQSISTENYDQAKKDLVEALSQASGKSPDEIEAKVKEWQQAFENAKAKAVEKAQEVAKKSAELVSQFAFMNFFLILASLIGSGVGGVVGARNVRRVVR